jgi:replicative DNA helicase
MTEIRTDGEDIREIPEGSNTEFPLLDIIENQKARVDLQQTLLDIQHSIYGYKTSGGQQVVFPWEGLNKAIGGIESGLCIFGGAPNYGKSAFVLNLYWSLLEKNPELLVFDFTLDDDARTRGFGLLASISGLPLRKLRLGGLSSSDQTRKLDACERIMEILGKRLIIIDSGCFKGRARFVEVIIEFMQEMRQQFPDRGILFIVDNIRNLYTAHRFGAAHEKDEYISLQLTEVCVKNNLLCFATAQMAKGSRSREVNPDYVKGGVGVAYDAKVIGLIYNDVKEFGWNASVYFRKENPEENEDPLLPILEVNIVKNKAGSFSDVIFYRFYPEQYRIEECSPAEQMFYRDARMSVMKKTGGVS